MKKTKLGKMKEGIFLVVVLGIIYDPKEKKILIGRREKDPLVPKLSWVFPGGKLNHKETEEQILKREIKEETGLKVANLGTVFSRIFKEEKKIFLIYNLCEVIGGKEKLGGNLKELKWVKPEELQRYFTTSFHPHLKEYIMNLK